MLTSAEMLATGLDELDAIADKYPSLAAFLRSPSSVAKYGVAVKAYYRKDRFGCATYEQTIEELTRAISKHPQLADALWAIRDGSSTFEVSETGRRQRFTVRRSRRPLHALWSLSAPRRCPATDCQSSDPLTPQKWAVAIQGSAWAAIEENGAFSGTSVLLVPMAREGLTISLATTLGAPLDKRVESYRLSTLEKPIRARFFHAVALGMRQMGWAIREPSLAEVSAAKPLGKFPRVTEVTDSGGHGKEFGELGDWRISDPLADRYANLEPRSCKPLAGRRGDLFSSFGASTTQPVPKPMLSLQNSTEDAIAKELIAEISKTTEPTVSPKRQGTSYEISLTGLLKGAKKPEERARAAYALSALGEKDQAQAPAIQKRSAQTPVSESEKALFRAMHSDPSEEVKAYASLALAKKGFDSPDIRRGLNRFGTSHKAFDLGSAKDRFGFDPGARDVDVERERNRRDMPSDGKIAKRFFEKIKDLKDPEVKEARMDRLLDVYFKSKNSEWMRGALNEIAMQDPELARQFIERANQKVGDACADKKPNDKQDEPSSKRTTVKENE